MHTPFYSLNEYYRELFGEKVYKISLNAGMTCPNRDGKIGVGGCIFCSAGGSGDFAAPNVPNITEQIDNAIMQVRKKYNGNKFIAYFQAYTNTYAPVERLAEIFYAAINDDRICGISIATRPDCLEQEKIELLRDLNQIKPVWIELGLQTVNESTAKLINRGYELQVFEDAVLRLNKADIRTVAHLIIGLPGESIDDYIVAARYLAGLRIHGVKLQLLHVLRGTELANMYKSKFFTTLSLEEYAKVIVDMIEILPPEMVIHRITGDGPKSILLAPLWSTDKKNVLNTIHKEFKTRNTYQGKLYKKI